jgi:C1A family cysteine protease
LHWLLIDIGDIRNGLVEYFGRRAYGKHIDASRLFLYKVTRKMLNFKGDTGAFLRSAMSALTLFGVLLKNTGPMM